MIKTTHVVRLLLIPVVALVLSCNSSVPSDPYTTPKRCADGSAERRRLSRDPNADVFNRYSSRPTTPGSAVNASPRSIMPSSRRNSPAPPLRGQSTHALRHASNAGSSAGGARVSPSPTGERWPNERSHEMSHAAIPGQGFLPYRRRVIDRPNVAFGRTIRHEGMLQVYDGMRHAPDGTRHALDGMMQAPDGMMQALPTWYTVERDRRNYVARRAVAGRPNYEDVSPLDDTSIVEDLSTSEGPTMRETIGRDQTLPPGEVLPSDEILPSDETLPRADENLPRADEDLHSPDVFEGTRALFQGTRATASDEQEQDLVASEDLVLAERTGQVASDPQSPQMHDEFQTTRRSSRDPSARLSANTDLQERPAPGVPGVDRLSRAQSGSSWVESVNARLFRWVKILLVVYLATGLLAFLSRADEGSSTSSDRIDLGLFGNRASGV